MGKFRQDNVVRRVTHWLAKKKVNKVPICSGCPDEREGKAAVVCIHASPNTDRLEVLRVAACAACVSDRVVEQAVVREALASGLSISYPEDFAYVPGKGIHCWVDNIPTLVGSKKFLLDKGVEIAEAGRNESSLFSLFVAQGCRFLGSLEIAKLSQN